MTSCGYGMWKKLAEEKFAPVPLTAVSVKVSIINLVAEVQVEQSYWNEAAHPIEVVYKFPLTEGIPHLPYLSVAYLLSNALLSAQPGTDMFKFSAEINGREMTSKVKEAVDQETDYDEAIRRDPSVSMMQEKLSNVFMVELGNVAAKSSANIRFKYITKLKQEGEELRFMLPWTIAPRYVPAKDESVVTDFWSKLFSKTHHTQEVPYKLKFEAAVTMTFGIKDIRSPTHKISMSNVPETKRSVTLSETTATMDRDLLLLVKVNNPFKASLVIEESYKGSSALMLNILPKFKQQKHKAELIFLIDRSSSMNGADIQQAKRALLLFLHSLPVDCFVNVVGFGTNYHVLFPEISRKYDDDVLKLVQDYAELMEADLGESEMNDSLKAISELPTIDGYLRQVFVITNGVVSNKDGVISLVQQLSGKARVFGFGLGCNECRHRRYFVEEIARAGNGTALFTSHEDGLGEKVIDLLRDALNPSWTDIKLEWEGFGKEDMMVTKPLLRQAPTNGMIPSVFSGKQLMVYALLKDGANIPKEAKLIVHTQDKTVLSITVSLNPMTIDGSLIHRMAAKKLIQGLQDRSNETLKKQIIKLSCTYGIVSPFTTFVAVDPMEPDKTLNGSPMMMKSSDVSDCLSSAMFIMPLGSMNEKSPEPVSTNIKKEKLKGPLGEGKMMKVICLQQSNGSFKLDDTLSKILISSLDDIIAAGQKAKCPDELWPTLIAVSYLTLGLPQFRDSWALVVEKANNWLGTQQFEETKLKKKAAKFVTANLKP